MDSLCWARLGANVTGVDLSDSAIEEAKWLNDEMGMNTKFICSNVCDLKEPLNVSPPDGGGDLEGVFGNTAE